jgi:nucleotidyltransferase substrate binding protein (TIGR01987 family)
MNELRIKYLGNDFLRGLQRLREGAAFPVSTPIIMDGVIQRFEFTFELGWKWLQAFLAYQGVEVNGPRTVLKESFRSGILNEGDSWITMLEDRNKSSYIYDESEAREIFGRILEKHLPFLERLGQIIALKIQ